MSYLTLNRIDSDGEVFHQAEFQNSHHGAPLLWSYLIDRFLGHTHPDSAVDQELWNLVYAAAVPLHFQFALATTFDRVVALGPAIHMLPKFFRQTGQALEHPGHWVAQAAVVDRLLEPCAPKTIGVCWWQTSIAEDPWIAHDTCRSCGQALDEPREFNIFEDEPRPREIKVDSGRIVLEPVPLRGQGEAP